MQVRIETVPVYLPSNLTVFGKTTILATLREFISTSDDVDYYVYVPDDRAQYSLWDYLEPMLANVMSRTVIVNNKEYGTLHTVCHS